MYGNGSNVLKNRLLALLSGEQHDVGLGAPARPQDRARAHRQLRGAVVTYTMARPVLGDVDALLAASLPPIGCATASGLTAWSFWSARPPPQGRAPTGMHSTDIRWLPPRAGPIGRKDFQ
jgi:hypothetical protein